MLLYFQTTFLLRVVQFYLKLASEVHVFLAVDWVLPCPSVRKHLHCRIITQEWFCAVQTCLSLIKPVLAGKGEKEEGLILVWCLFTEMEILN